MMTPGDFPFFIGLILGFCAGIVVCHLGPEKEA